MKQSDDVSLKK